MLIRLIQQIFKFGIVGLVCFAADYGLMMFFTDFCNINYLISCAASFVISTVINYILSMRFVFKSSNSIGKRAEFILFVIMSTIGLILTEILMMCLVECMDIYYMISKIIVTSIVMVYNFVTRKFAFEKRRCFYNEK